MRAVAGQRAQKDFFAELKRKGRYETPSLRFRFLDDIFLMNSDLWFYWREFLVVAVGSVIARRGRFDGAAWVKRAFKVMRVIEAAGGQIRIEGAEHMIRQDQPTVYVANHMSMIETMILPGGLIQPFHPVSVVVKQSLLDYPVFGPIMRAVKPIAVSRRQPREDLKQVLEQGVACLKGGRSVLVFPQATRSAVFDPGAFNSLGVKLAHRAGAPVMPVALRTDFQGVGQRWRDFGPLFRRKPIMFRFGEAIMPDVDAKTAHRKTVAFIGEAMQDWGLSGPDGTGGIGKS